MNWTEGRVKAFIIATLRSGARRWPPKYETLQDAFVEKKINLKSKREAKHYKCNSCSNLFIGSDVQVDHIDPVVSPTEGFTTWDNYIERLFCKKENLQVLCLTCHKQKSKLERIKK